MERAIKSIAAIERANNWMQEFVNKKMGSMLTSNIEVVTYLEKNNIRKFDIQNIDYWINQFIHYSNGERIEEYVDRSDYPITSLCMIRCIDSLNFLMYDDWAKKQLRKIFNNFFLDELNCIYLFLLLRNSYIDSDLVLRTNIVDNLCDISLYASTLEISVYIFGLIRCDSIDRNSLEIRNAVSELVKRQKQDGSWLHYSMDISSSNNEDLERSDKNNLLVTCCAVHALILYNYDLNVNRLKKAKNWIINQQNSDGFWSSPYGNDVGLFTCLCIDSIKLVEKKNSTFYRKETGVKMINLNRYQIINKKYDVFISHANKDKIDFVEGLVTEIKKLGIEIFYDKEEISWGDNWKEQIINGTKISEFAIIVISDNFFDREWTEKELFNFLERQNDSGQKIILPLIHNITLKDFAQKYPVLDSLQVIDTSQSTLQDITISLAKVLIRRYRER